MKRVMRTSKLGLIAFGLVLPMVNQGNVAAAAVLDSSLFNHKYEGDVVPVTDSNGVTTPSYATGAPDISGPSSDGNIMTYQNTVGTGGGYWESNSSIWAGGTNPVSDANGSTIEFSIKVGTDATAGPWGAFQVFARDSGSGSNGNPAHLAVGPSMTGYRTSGGSIAVLDTNSNTDAFHTFRIAQDPDSGNLWVWRDGILLLAGGTDLWASTGAAYMFFGDGGGYVGGPTMELDYFRWDSTGAYAPIPEPASLALIGLGTLLMFKRRYH